MSLINEALKRASDAQNQAAQRPRGPKGVEDLPVPMTPVAARERPTWLPVVGIGLVVVLLLGASGYFFAQWWKERKAWQPYATEDLDEDGQPRTNLVAKAGTTKVTLPPTKGPVTPTPVATNPPPVVKIPVIPPTPPPEPPKTNPPLVANVVPPVVTPRVSVIATNPVVPPPLTNPPPPKVEPVVTAMTNLPAPPKPPTPPVPPKQVDPPATKVPAVEFPELKLQGISRGKKKTFIIMNGKTLSLGDRIEGVTLLKIDADSVTVEKDGAKRELFLLR